MSTSQEQKEDIQSPQYSVTEQHTANQASPTEQNQASTTAHETDVWYQGYAGRAMWFSFTLCIIWTGVSVWCCFRWPFDKYTLSHEIALWAMFGLIAVVWAFQMFRWVYRKVLYRVRVTTKRVYYYRGTLYKYQKIMDLDQIDLVVMQQNFIDRLLKMGTIHLINNSHAEESIIIPAISKPQDLVMIINSSMDHRREQKKRLAS